MKKVTLEGGLQRLNAHTKDECLIPERCSIHNPSDHFMRSFPQWFRSDRGLMERICPHGIGHPDPDDLAYKRSVLDEKEALAEGVHGCDGCCIQQMD